MRMTFWTPVTPARVSARWTSGWVAWRSLVKICVSVWLMAVMVALRSVPQQPREAAVGEHPPAGLAGRAVVDGVFVKRDLADFISASRALLAESVVHRVAVGCLRGEAGARQRQQPIRRLAQQPHDRRVQPLDLLALELRAHRVGRQARGVEDLVGVGAADAGDGALITEEGVQPVRVGLQLPAQRRRVEGGIQRFGPKVLELCGQRLGAQPPGTL